MKTLRSLTRPWLPTSASSSTGTSSPSRADILRVAALTGLLTSSFSTLTIVLGSHRVGRGVKLSFMEVGTVLLRNAAVDAPPRPRGVAAGVLVHQSADISWAVAFFGLGARWTWRLRPRAVLALAPAWAAAAAAAEYWLILPWLQPRLRMQTPYWVALMVHVSSAAAYPLFFWLRAERLGARRADAPAGRRTAVALGGALALLGGLEALEAAGREPRWPLNRAGARDADAAFMRGMAAHHAVGARMGELAAELGERDELRMLGRLIAAEQRAEIGRLRSWWRSWRGGDLPPLPPAKRDTMPGMPPAGAVDALAELRGVSFERRFLDLIVPHHEGALQMIRELRRGGDPRLRLFAAQVGHAQRGQIARLRSLRRALDAS